MTDHCSNLAYRSLKAKGALAVDKLSVLNIFRKMMMPLTAREAFKAANEDGLVGDTYEDFVGFRARITELSKDKYGTPLLEKYDKQVCRVTGELVNRWKVKGMLIVERQGEMF